MESHETEANNGVPWLIDRSAINCGYAYGPLRVAVCWLCAELIYSVLCLVRMLSTMGRRIVPVIRPFISLHSWSYRIGMNQTRKVGADVTYYDGLDSANFARAQGKRSNSDAMCMQIYCDDRHWFCIWFGGFTGLMRCIPDQYSTYRLNVHVIGFFARLKLTIHPTQTVLNVFIKYQNLDPSQ